MAIFTLNGHTFTGGSVRVRDNEIWVDGKLVDAGASGEPRVLEVRILEGRINDLSADGYVTCGAVEGDVSAGGYVTCGAVGGDVSAGGYVRCGNVGGDVSAGGYVRRG
jgi:hypothetical protein